MSGLNALLKYPQQVGLSLATNRDKLYIFVEQGDSPDAGSNLPTPVVSETKRKRRSKAVAKVAEVKRDEPMVTSVSPKTKPAPTAGLLPYPHNHGIVTY